jgi:hypothetical protein
MKHESTCRLLDEPFYFLTKPFEPQKLERISFSHIFSDALTVSVRLEWSEPFEPNGLLLLLKLNRDDNEIFSTKNMSIFEYVDVGLAYGKNYTYELAYFNQVGHVTLKSWHYTGEHLPVSMRDPECMHRTSNEFTVLWHDPVHPNGLITHYEIDYKKSSEFAWRRLKLAKSNSAGSWNSYKLTDLESCSQYDVQIGACNSIGCLHSNVVSGVECTTLEWLPESLNAPIVYDVAEQKHSEHDQVDLLITWNKPVSLLSTQFTLLRTTIELSMTFESEPSFGSLGKKVIYVGSNSSFIDLNVGSYNLYEYSVEMNNSAGRLLSEATRVKTRATLPTKLNNVGTIISITNQSVSLKLTPPIYINGALVEIYILIVYINFNKEIGLLSRANITSNQMQSNQLLEFLDNVTITDLKPGLSYKIKSKFCNQIGCVESTEKLKFRTLANVGLIYFLASNLTKSSVMLNWKLQRTSQSIK